MDKLTLSVAEAAKHIGVGLNAMYSLIHSPAEPPHLRIGERTIRIPVAGFMAWIDERSAQSQSRK